MTLEQLADNLYPALIADAAAENKPTDGGKALLLDALRAAHEMGRASAEENRRTRDPR